MKTILAFVCLLVLEIAAATSIPSRSKVDRSEHRPVRRSNSIDEKVDLDDHEDDNHHHAVSSPFLEAFEKEILYIVDDYCEELRELVENMKQSIILDDEAQWLPPQKRRNRVTDYRDVVADHHDGEHDDTLSSRTTPPIRSVARGGHSTPLVSQTIRYTNPFLKLFRRGRRVESIVSLWSIIDSETTTTKEVEDGDDDRSEV
jgi:hypothetical protein